MNFLSDWVKSVHTHVKSTKHPEAELRDLVIAELRPHLQLSMKEPRNMAAIQLQLEMSSGLWAGRQPSSSRNTTSKTGVGKQHSSLGVPQKPTL
ncbi:hypothetical protein EYF80_022773 [Liparis tanakae]|uniref:Uncharacterized protein n=1 Tax=Liparis tanakae TaxID=230148 RepID=A0A4Z2HN35_9TELE|nr:hypothetical protein EYF80_022773 [Liparis tanakae]